jgi:PTS system ascorbate-specific IIA component
MGAVANVMCERLDDGDGVLVLTDLFGSTPSNISVRLLSRGNIEVVSGVNLSMLIRVMNYPELSLPILVTKALTGGHDGINLCEKS